MQAFRATVGAQPSSVRPRQRRRLLFRQWRRRPADRTGIDWLGDFPSWESARARSTGYEHPDILERVRQGALRVKAGGAAFERDGFVFTEPEFASPILSILVHAAAAHGGRLQVLDFGGALGSTYFQHWEWLDRLREVHWCVVEQENFVHCGRTEFQDDRLRFFSSVADVLAFGQPDVALFSNALGYLREPFAALEQVAAAGIEFLLIDRTGFTRDDRERITVQRMPARICRASFPCRFFSRTELLDRLSHRYDVVAAFPTADEPPPFADFLGFGLKRRASWSDE